ncbi:MAG: hypothetical protein JRF34_10555 [Deltaproteobacteria bacterium]|nr:hypothetical protein [Deltaproteobacteria bacterium]
MKDKNIHLTEDQILLSLIDENDLPDEMRCHLEDCTACQDKRTSLLSELEYLGKMAGEFTPTPQKKSVLLVREPGRQRYHFPAFASGLAATVLVVFLCSVILFSDSSKQMKENPAVESEVRLHLVEDILDEPAISRHYLDITLTSDSYFDDEFLEFVIPLEEESNSIQGFSSLSFKA